MIFEQRLELMDDDDVTDTITGMRHDVVDTLIAKAIPDRAYPEQWNAELLEASAKAALNIDIPINAWVHEDGIDVEQVRDRMVALADETAEAKIARFTPDIMKQVQKSILLQSIDGLWRDHLVTLDHLSKVVGWRGLAQRDPLNEYKQEAYELFQKLLADLRELVTNQLSHVEIQRRPPQPELNLSGLSEIHLDPNSGENELAGASIAGALGATAMSGALGSSALFSDNAGPPPGLGADPRLTPIDPKLLVGVSRNAPCPCGSGKKFKHCHGSF